MAFHPPAEKRGFFHCLCLPTTGQTNRNYPGVQEGLKAHTGLMELWDRLYATWEEWSQKTMVLWKNTFKDTASRREDLIWIEIRFPSPTK